MLRRKSKLWNVPREELESAIENSFSFSDLAKKMGVSYNCINTLEKIASSFSISTEHFKTKAEILKEAGQKRSIKPKEYLVTGRSFNTTRQKDSLINAGLLKEECAECGLGPEWQGKHIALHLDHIDGDRLNNTLDNLRILCPNCHSQTSSYAGKNLKRTKVFLRYCIQCNKKINYKKNCPDCYPTRKEKVRKVERPTLDFLNQLIQTYSYTEIGRRYGVSDNAVRKWFSSYGVSPPRKYKQ